MPDAHRARGRRSASPGRSTSSIGFFGGDAGRTRRGRRRACSSQPLLRTRIGGLSKGQRKRALLAIGLLTPQPVLLVDEPFDGLDLRQTREMGAALRRHAAGGRTLFLSIHQIGDAARVCDRFVLLERRPRARRGHARRAGARAAAAHGRPARRRDLEEVFLALT